MLVSKRWRGASALYRWRCAKRHSWLATYTRVVTSGTWCVRCARISVSNRRRYPQSDAWATFDAAVRDTWPAGSKRLSKKYEGTHYVVRVRCGNCKKTHHPTFKNLVKRKSGPLCLVRESISRGATGVPKLTLRLAGDEAAFRQRFRIVLAGATDRDLSFDLNPEIVRSLILEDCVWCGRPTKEIGKMVYPSSRSRPAGTREDGFGPCIGLDRIDNRLGYISGNVVPSCEACNVAKGNAALMVWLQWLDAIRGSSSVNSVCARVAACTSVGQHRERIIRQLREAAEAAPPLRREP